jgi:nucleoside-diphosphate-sugar epimerase
MEKLKILVTGGAGFIGSHLINELLKKGHSVVVLDNLSSGKKQNLEKAFSNEDFTFILGDIRDDAALKDALKGVNAVAHLAALIDVTSSVTDPVTTNDVNVAGTLKVLQSAVKGNVSKFVFASSTAVYGEAKVLPITEETPLNPISPYAASKVAGEAYCKSFQSCFGLNTVILRFFNVYGPRSENSPYSGVITKFLRQALKNEALNIYGDGEQTRDFIHVNDIVAALILALENPKVGGETFNVCTGVQTSINELANTINLITERNLNPEYSSARTGEIRFSYGDPSKAEDKLEFKSKVSLKEGITQLLDTEKVHIL